MAKPNLFYHNLENTFKSLLVSTLFKKSEKISPDKLDLAKIKKILVVRQHDPMGDVLLSSAVFPNLRAFFPSAVIDVITRPGLKDLFLNNRNISNVIIFEKKKLFFPWYYFNLKKSLRRKEYDLALVLGSTSVSFLSLLLARLAEAGVSAGYEGIYFHHKDFTERLLNIEVPYEENKSLHQAEKNLDLLRYLKIPVANSCHNMGTSEEEDNWARVFLEKNGFEPGKLIIGIHPGANRLDHRWPVEYFAAVGDALIEKLDAQIILFSGQAERQLVENYNACAKHRVFSAPLLSLREFAALVKPLSLFLCNDTGVLHIAAALGVKTLALFARTEPLVWNPKGESHYYLRSTDKIIASIKPDEVKGKALEILAGK